MSEKETVELTYRTEFEGFDVEAEVVVTFNHLSPPTFTDTSIEVREVNPDPDETEPVPDEVLDRFQAEIEMGNFDSEILRYTDLYC